MTCGCVKPIVCPPQYVVRDHYAQQVVPVIHPVVTVNRQNIVNVPQHFIQPYTTNVAGTESFYPGYSGYAGGGASLFGRRFL
ncbi:hypothetical protein Sgly_1533 [Syntrophobotulus glycolicus DSM 8271]|uniref:Spore coat protein D n=1 Tax=Syntrophobotulus glycolicus (strain DSM 8271 / FlGlyR) TaxID=645991 RepID=F0SXK0_SYNGF|nr:hypothetical protein [Syntrophobotulus glycolicus]ADY55833.1 hypothetical protein Sgly_1533 [Syntrophobotulus glycolicus DSM 8271]